MAPAEFHQQILPSGKVTLTGIVGDWGRLQPQRYTQDITTAL
uniref:Uncharacterized protein n=1 Tax=Roseihalotalea indica TaxID=2867963 RepID=A0AA49GNY1_9BACT|nr:hypothetical protein K4G66_03250 [Tunicatimonas sp. TK19036]